MNQGKTVFAQLMSMIPEYEFDKCVDRYNENHRVRKSSPIVPIDDFPNLFINNNF